MANTRKGAKWTDEQREKARLSMLGKNKKKVINIATGEIYDSVENAAKAIGYSRENLINKLRGKLKNNTNLKYY